MASKPGEYAVFWPSGERRLKVRPLARRLDTLNGKKVAQLWDYLFAGDEVFEGKVEGQVIWPVRGAQGHGYDPMFVPEGHDITFAEMDANEKNRISHRADAFAKFINWLEG